MQHLIEAAARGGCRLDRQGVGFEELQRDDFAIGHRNQSGGKIRHDIDRDVVAPGEVQVEEQTVQAWPSDQGDRGFLLQFAGQRIFGGLADFDAAAGQMPARRVAMTQQQNLACGVYDDGPHAERHAAPHPRP